MKKKIKKYQPGGSTTTTKDGKKVVNVTTYTPKSNQERDAKAKQIFEKWGKSVQSQNKVKPKK